MHAMIALLIFIGILILVPGAATVTQRAIFFVLAAAKLH